MQNSSGSASFTEQTRPVEKTGADGHPRGFFFIFWGEFAERSSYYGMRAILFLYLTTVIHLSDTKAGPLYSGFKMACYLLPLLGGYIADRWLGKYWTIVGFSVPYVMGQFILTIPTEMTLFVALALLACGSGVIKPNLSTLMGQTYDEKRPGNESLRSQAFQWFYLSINIGALLSQFSMPWLRDNFGYSVAFLFPAFLMTFALTAFAAGKRHYAHETPGQHVEKTPEERQQQWQTVVRLLGVFGMIVFFWMAYEHNDTLWIAFTRDYVHLPQLPGMSHPIPPDQLQFINALCVIIFIPVFTLLFARLDPDVKIFTAMRKIFAGFLFTALAAGLIALAAYSWHGQAVTQMVERVVDGQTKMVPIVVATDKVSVLWVVGAYIVLTIGEVLLYGTALELAYTAAPKTMKSMITACFLVTNFLGNLINMYWMTQYGGSLNDPADQRGPLSPGPFFAITAVVVAVAAIGFLYVGRRFQQGNQPAPGPAAA
jgi:POT family proton-dependent oligopeptide transporter